MFSLIITVISIALVSVLALAAIYYVGNNIDEAKARIDATEYINIGETIKGAIGMFRVTNGDAMPSTIQDLVDDGLLGSLPEGSWALSGSNVTQTDISEEACAKVNKYLHDDETVFLCSALAPGVPGCCDTTG